MDTIHYLGISSMNLILQTWTVLHKDLILREQCQLPCGKRRSKASLPARWHCSRNARSLCNTLQEAGFTQHRDHSFAHTCTSFAALEYVSVEKRSLISNLGLAVGLTVGGAVEPWILKALGDWKIFHIILFAQAAVVVVTPL